MGESVWKRWDILVLVAIMVGAVVLGSQSVLRWGSPPQKHSIESIVADVVQTEFMMQHEAAKQLPAVINVTKGIHIAIGFALANSIWLSGPEGVTVVDTTESMEAAREVYSAMREVIQDPIKGIIYTHSHPDHTFGAKAFIEDPDNPPEIWASSELEFEMDNVMTTQQINFVRGMRQFGTLLPRTNNAGIGARLRYANDNSLGLVMPNRLMYGPEQNITIAGLPMTLIHIPGETEDQIGVWLPEQRAFLCADDMYKAFPNLYAIRGVPMRNARKWINSLDRMRKLRPLYLVPSHGRPIEGEQQIYEVLTAYRDGLQYVHDQTVRYINKGLGPEDIARLVRLPRELLEVPYLRQLYGTVEWSVRSVFDQYMGWFSGNAAQMAAITSEEKAEWMMDLAGGKENLLRAAQKALENGNARWALVLSSHVFDLDRRDPDALEVRLAALKAMARQMSSTNGRHYYLTTALEDHDLVDNTVSPKTRADMARHMTVSQLFIALKTRLMSERVQRMDRKILFEFTDTDETWFVHLRRGILETSQEVSGEWDLKVTVTLTTWQQILGGALKSMQALHEGKVKLQGHQSHYRDFFTYFENLESVQPSYQA